jgi:hypothetical protein
MFNFVYQPNHIPTPNPVFDDLFLEPLYLTGNVPHVVMVISPFEIIDSSGR